MTLHDEAHSNYTFVKRAWRHLLLLVATLMPPVSHAYTAIAQVDGAPHGTLYAAWGYQTQKAADLAAVKGCRTAAKQLGLTKKVATCAVMHRQKGFGGGAIVCGAAGCNLSTGLDTQQDAVDRAFRQCEQQKMGNCQTTDIISWWDEAGYSQRNEAKREPKPQCGPPPGRTVRSTYQCSNGDCVRTFENGCTQRFQAQYCHDPISGKWDWKPDGC